MHDNGDKVILIGEQRSWTISNAVVKQYIEYSESDFVLLCDIENSQGILLLLLKKMTISALICSKRTKSHSRKLIMINLFLDDQVWCP